MTCILIDIVTAILVLSGASSAEDLSESEMERYCHYAEHPLRINIASRSRILASGLMSAYQVASLEDYRRRNGDVLGVLELGLVDGFNAKVAEALGIFVSFESTRPPGERDDRRVNQTIMLRTGVRNKDGTAAAVGAKYHLEAGERAEFNWSSRNSYASPGFPPGTFSAALYGKGGGKIILGDFNARFGQGLAMWSGFSMSGFPTESAFHRNGTGFSPTGSFNPPLRGVAAVVDKSRWTFSAATALRPADDSFRLMPILAACRLGRRGQFGLLAFCDEAATLSADGTLGLGHFTFFGECAISSRSLQENGMTILRTRFAAVGGASWAPAYQTRITALARYYPADYNPAFAGPVRSAFKVADETGFSLGARLGRTGFTFDAARHPAKGGSSFKGIFQTEPSFNLKRINLSPVLKLSSRYRPGETFQWRNEIRTDLKAAPNAPAAGRAAGMQATCRLHLLKSESWAGLAYAECGYKTPSDSASVRLSAFLRGTYFKTGSWNDRIYCYERDIPGSFSVPACYDRGWGLSALLGVELCRTRMRHSLYLKGSLLRYPGTGRAGSSELKLQYQAGL